jgi:predicted nucleic acid-binding protein
MAFVLDASVTLSWLFRDETSAYTTAVLDRLGQEQVYVPGVWALEVANGLLIGERRGRLAAHDVTEAIRLVLELPLTMIDCPRSVALTSVHAVARSHGLSSYDAAYLHLAGERGVSLATQDSQLVAAANSVGVPVLAPGALA